MATAFKHGNRFKRKGDITQRQYIFHEIKFERGLPVVYCEEASTGEKVKLVNHHLADLEHV